LLRRMDLENCIQVQSLIVKKNGSIDLYLGTGRKSFLKGLDLENCIKIQLQGFSVNLIDSKVKGRFRNR